MMQKEVADRFSAVPNTKDYNALSIVTQYRCEVRNVMKVPRNVFMPKPNVDSSVLQFRFLPSKDINEEAFFSLVKACFKQRRKTILNNIRHQIRERNRRQKNWKKPVLMGKEEQKVL